MTLGFVMEESSLIGENQ